jgi:hypothetical protein
MVVEAASHSLLDAWSNGVVLVSIGLAYTIIVLSRITQNFAGKRRKKPAKRMKRRPRTSDARRVKH